jgi:hypothetical protein
MEVDVRVTQELLCRVNNRPTLDIYTRGHVAAEAKRERNARRLVYAATGAQKSQHPLAFKTANQGLRI